ncbi:hypothetical protein ACTOWA_04780 [Herbaspirillum seropedicae]|uniref:hypothetical protein n=1 Tax=Herbaspirillum seropedicae TaxID=964 RepID=UPI003F8D14E7
MNNNKSTWTFLGLFIVFFLATFLLLRDSTESFAITFLVSYVLALFLLLGFFGWINKKPPNSKFFTALPFLQKLQNGQNINVVHRYLIFIIGLAVGFAMLYIPKF